jgi:hypothetical protein
VRAEAIYALERIARDSATDHPIVIDRLATFIREHSREPQPRGPHASAPEFKTRLDIQAAATVIKRLNKGRDHHPVNLSGADLSAADLNGANLSGADLSGANLSGANLNGTDLNGANLDGANLDGANLDGANLSVADPSGANLNGANLSGAIWPGDVPAPEKWVRDSISGQLHRASLDGDTPPAGQRPVAADLAAAGPGDDWETGPAAVSMGRSPIRARRLRRSFLICVIFCPIIILSYGSLAFVPFLWLALIRHRTRDWAVFAAYVAAPTMVILLARSSAPAPIGLLILLLLIALIATVHTLVAYRPKEGVPSWRVAHAARVAGKHQQPAVDAVAAGDPQQDAGLGHSKPASTDSGRPTAN